MFRDGLIQACRSLWQRKGVTATTVVTLALGVGLNVAVFSVVNGLLLKSPPYPDSEAIVQIQRPSAVTALDGQVSGAEFGHWRDAREPFEAVAGYRTREATVGSGDRGRMARVGEVTAGLFEVLRTLPALGRPFNREEEMPGADRVVVISHRLSAVEYGDAAQALGSDLRIEGIAHRVIGVMPPGFIFPDDRTDLWIPLFPGTVVTVTEGGGRSVSVPQFPAIARLRPGTSPSQVAASLNRNRTKPGEQFAVVPWHEAVARPYRRLLLLLQGGVLLVLLIACANVASLLVAVGHTRFRDMATRLAIGAGRSHLIRQLLVEALITSVCSAGAALAVARAALISGQALAEAQGGSLLGARVDTGAMAFGLALALVAGLAAALPPALRVTRLAPASVLKATDDTLGTGSRSRRRVTGGRVFGAVQLTVAVVLLVVSLSLIASFITAVNRKPRYADPNLVTAELRFLAGGTLGLPARQAMIRQILEEASVLPAVSGAAVSSALPIPAGVSYFDVSGESRENGDVSFSPEGTTRYVVVSPDYFRVMSVGLARGRHLSSRDAADGPTAVVVSRRFAQERFPGVDPLGRSVFFLNRSWQIVGVVDDVNDVKTGSPRALVYCLFQQLGDKSVSWQRTLLTVVLKARSSPDVALAELQPLVRTRYPYLAMGEATSMQARFFRAMGPLNFYGAAMTLLAVMALALASLGVYTLMNRSVTARSREIGVRLAIGASPSEIFGMVMREASALALCAIVIGLPLSLAAHRVVRAAVFGLDPLSAPLPVLAAAILEVVSLVACALPAWRACTTDPVTCLRADG